jgi:hypothetical protein
MMTPPRTLQQLLDVEAIKQLKADYFYLMDSKRWEEWKELFTEDFAVDGPAAHPGGRHGFVEFVRELLQDVTSFHQGSMPVIDIADETTARGRWSMSDILWLPAGHPWSAGEPTRQHGYGHYHEEYRRDAGTWKIARMRLSRVVVLTVPDRESGEP